MLTKQNLACFSAGLIMGAMGMRWITSITVAESYIDTIESENVARDFKKLLEASDMEIKSYDVQVRTRGESSIILLRNNRDMPEDALDRILTSIRQKYPKRTITKDARQ